MRTRNILAVLVFMAAIGSAIASTYLIPVPGYSRKTDVPIQVINCQFRDECDGATSVCRIILDHDGNSSTPPIAVTLYDGITQPGSLCGIPLMRN